MTTFRSLMHGNELIVAPVALNPLMARLAEQAGFKAVYLSGGSLGWLKCVTEANLTLPEMIETVVDMRTACGLPVVLDAGGGWGDPVHIHRTIAMSRGCRRCGDRDRGPVAAAPGRASCRHRPPGADRIHGEEGRRRRSPPAPIPTSSSSPAPMRAACRGLDEALRRGEAFKRAGADMLFIHTRNAEEMRIVGERLPPPLMSLRRRTGLPICRSRSAICSTSAIASPPSSGTAFAAMMKAVRQSYECLANDTVDPFLGVGGADQEMKAAQNACDLTAAVGDRAAHDEGNVSLPGLSRRHRPGHHVEPRDGVRCEVDAVRDGTARADAALSGARPGRA